MWSAKPNSRACFCSCPHENPSHSRWEWADAYVAKNNCDVHVTPDLWVIGSIATLSVILGYSSSVVIRDAKISHPNVLDAVVFCTPND